MAALKTAEVKIEKLFKGAPPLPDNTKDLLAKIWPWLALIGGVLQLFAALALWRLADWANKITDVGSSLSAYYTSYANGPTGVGKAVIYLGALLLVVDAVILIMAFPKLQKRLRAGWDLLFLASLLNLVYAVLQIFTFQRGFGNFLFSLIASAIGFYLLFQVREKFAK